MRIYDEYVVVAPMGMEPYNVYTDKAVSIARAIDVTGMSQIHPGYYAGKWLNKGQQPNVIRVYRTEEIEWGVRRVDEQHSDPVLIELSFADGMENIHTLMRYVIGDLDIPDDVLKELLETHEEITATALGLLEKIGNNRLGHVLKSLIHDTFKVKAQEILRDYYAKMNLLDDVEVIGTTALIHSVDKLTQKIVMVMGMTKPLIERMFVKCRESDKYTIGQILGNAPYRYLSSCGQLKGGVIGVLSNKPDVEMDPRDYAPMISSADDARKIAQAIKDFGLNGKKSLKVALKFDELTGTFLTEAGHFQVSVGYPMLLNGEDED